MRLTIRKMCLELPEVHVHGLPLNKDQQLGPVRQIHTLARHSSCARRQGSRRLDESPHDGLKRCESDGGRPGAGKHRELTIVGMAALNKWTFDPQLKGDEPVDGELTVRIHFRTR